MGLKDFYKILKRAEYAPKAVGSLRGKRFVLDGKALFYRYVYGVSMEDNLADGIVCRVDRLLQQMKVMGAKMVILACDGKKVPQEKKPTLAARSDARQKSKRRAEVFEIFCKRQKTEGGTVVAEDGKVTQLTPEKKQKQDEDNITLLEKKQRQSRSLSSADVDTILDGLRKCGHDVFVAEEEADFAMSWLSQNELVDYVVADDADLLVSCKNVIRGLPAFVLDTRNVAPEPLVYDHDDILVALDMSKEQLTQLACILGCDYQPSICKVGSVTAVKAIHKYGTVKKFIESWTPKERAKFTLPSTPESYCSQVCRSSELLTCHWPDKDALTMRYQPRTMRAKMLTLLQQIEQYD